MRIPLTFLLQWFHTINIILWIYKLQMTSFPNFTRLAKNAHLTKILKIDYCWQLTIEYIWKLVFLTSSIYVLLNFKKVEVFFAIDQSREFFKLGPQPCQSSFIKADINFMVTNSLKNCSVFFNDKGVYLSILKTRDL